MSVLLETSLGDITIDLFVDECPLATCNFVKLCRQKFYNDSRFHKVERNFVVTGGYARDATEFAGPGETIWGRVDPKHRFAGGFPDEIPSIKSERGARHYRGVIACANETRGVNGSAFYITLSGNTSSLDGKHTVFGEVVEGTEVLDKFNKVITDQSGTPLQTLRIRHTVVLEDPFENDMPGFDDASELPPSPKSPVPIEDVEYEKIETPEEEIKLLEKIRANEARSRAVALEILGDIDDADEAPPENVLFVCKLNPYTEEDDLKTIFAQFGEVTSCEIIRDFKTGDSLQYGFVEFRDVQACRDAFFKMQGALVDDRRIHVNFCQSVGRKRRRRNPPRTEGEERLPARRDGSRRRDVERDERRQRDFERDWERRRDEKGDRYNDRSYYGGDDRRREPAEGRRYDERRGPDGTDKRQDRYNDRTPYEDDRRRADDRRDDTAITRRGGEYRDRYEEVRQREYDGR